VSIIFCGCSSQEVRKKYFSNGALNLQTTLEAGLRHGEELVYDSLGNLLERRTYVRDTLQGSLFTYFKSGRLSTITEYAQGKKEGAFFSFNRNGNIAQFGLFKGGYQCGVWQNYSETDSGKVVLEAGVLNVQGHAETYYLKRPSAEGNMVYAYLPLAIGLQRTLSRKDTMVFSVELSKNEYDSAFLIVGDYDENFYLKGKADTIKKVKDNRAVLRFVAEKPGAFFVRGFVWTFQTTTFEDSVLLSETLQSSLHFEEKYEVLQEGDKKR
jgi:hypothetical protein